MRRCDEGLCSNADRCIRICADEDDCAYSDDVECGAPQQLFGDVPDEFRLCQGRGCEGADDCAEDQWCGTLDWDADAGEDGELGFRCASDNDDPAAVGLYTEECNTQERFGPIVRCQEGLCNTRALLNGRRCGLPCAAQADCPEDYKCEPQWLGVEDDGQRYTRMITYDACVFAPGSDRICGGDADCDEGEACNISITLLVLDEDGEYEDDEGNRVTDGVDLELLLESRCHPYEDGQLAGGEACQDADECQNGLCLNSGVCATLCADTGDCADDQACNILVLDPDDQGFSWGFCTDWRGSRAACDGPLDSCDGVDGSEDGELCLLNILVEPTADAPMGVEWFCGQTDGEGRPGEQCDQPADCESGICIAGVEDEERVGYCSAGCAADADCPDLHSCANNTFFQRSGPAGVEAAVGRVCKPWLECTFCNDATECPSGYACHHMRDRDNEEEDVYVGMCLIDCQGADGDADRDLCDDTEIDARVNCREADDERGDGVDGSFACQPNNLTSCFP